MKRQDDKWNKRWYGEHKPGVFVRFMASVFSILIRFRRSLYRWKIFKTHQFSVPVIVVGNITVGGGGKTPMVINLAQRIKSKGYRVGIVSRGYGGQRKVEPMLVTANAVPAASGDEPLLMAKALNIPVMVAKKRVLAIKTIIKQNNLDVVLSDDGMQHYAMGRQAEIVMLDAERQLGNGHLLPAGPLREPADRIDESDLVIYKGIVPQGLYYQHQIVSIYALNQPSKQRDIASLRNQKIIAMAGIANPEGFFKMLAANGLAVIKQSKPDHYTLTDADFNDEYINLITEKDAVKCSGIENPNVWVVKTDIYFSNQADEAIDQLISGVMT